MYLGNIARGGSFFNRTKEIAILWQTLHNDHIVMSGPRRLGKSSLLAALADQAATYGYAAKLIDLSGEQTIAGFMAKLKAEYPSFADKASATLNKLNPLKRVKKAEGKAMGMGLAVEMNDAPMPKWQLEGDKLITRLQQNGPQRQLIMLDEFSVFIEALLENEPQQVKAFLGWFRRWRQQDNHHIRFLLSGSIGLHSLLEHHQLQTLINDCFAFTLGPFSSEHAIAMAQTFAEKKQLHLPQEVAEHLCQRVGWLSPYYVNLLLNASTIAAKDRQSNAIAACDIDQAYETLMGSRSHFSHWAGRLKKELDASHYNLCLALLSHIARAEQGLNLQQLSARMDAQLSALQDAEALLQKLWFKLTEEGYLSLPDGEGKVQFLSFLLRDYWLRNHV